MPLVTIFLSIILIFSIIQSFKQNNKGVEFFVETEFEQALAHVRARGNLSISEKDRLVKMVEKEILGVEVLKQCLPLQDQADLQTQMV